MMPDHPRVVYEPHDVEAELVRLGLTQQVLLDALNDGDEARTMTTATDPPMFPGITFWAVTVRSLRSNLISEGWEKNDAGNYSVIVSPDEKHQIAVSSGTVATGVRTGNPKTKNPKGPATSGAVRMNRAQCDLFAHSKGPLRLYAPVPTGKMTWILLFCDAGKEIRSELSLPLVVDDELKASEWETRIILPTIDRDGPEPSWRTDTQPDLDVPVHRRAV